MKAKKRSCSKECRGKGIGQTRNNFMKAMNTTKGKFQTLGRKLKGKGFMKKLKKVGSAVVQGAKQAAQFAKDSKILSRGAMLMGRPDLAMAAQQFGAGIGQTRNRMMAAASATKGAFKTFGRKLKGGATDWAKRCAANKKRAPRIVKLQKTLSNYKKVKNQCVTRGKEGYVTPKLSQYQLFIKTFMKDNAEYEDVENKVLMKIAALLWSRKSEAQKKMDFTETSHEIPEHLMNQYIDEAWTKYPQK